MSKRRRKVKKQSPEQRERFLRMVIADCTAYLSKYQVYLPQRTETMQDSLKAITELERESRAELDDIVNSWIQLQLPI